MGGFLALCAAATFALNNAFARRGVLSGTVLQAMSVSVPLGIPLFLIAAIATNSTPYLTGFTGAGYAFLAAAGIVHFVLGRYCNYRAVKAIGSNLAGPLMEASVLVALVLAVILLGEKLTAMKVVGIILILGGPALIFERKGDKKPAKSAQLAFTPAYFEGYLFSILAAFAYGTSPILVRFALEKADWQASLAGGLISYVAATAVVVAVILAAGQTRHVRNISGETVKWFCLAGLFVAFSQMLRYVALSLAPVTVVQPIQRMSLIFRIVFSYFINRQYEVFNSRMLLGTIVSIIGAMMLSISIEDVRSVLGLPEILPEVFSWSWP